MLASNRFNVFTNQRIYKLRGMSNNIINTNIHNNKRNNTHYNYNKLKPNFATQYLYTLVNCYQRIKNHRFDDIVYFL